MTTPTFADLRLPLRIVPVSDEGLAIEDAGGVRVAFVHYDDGCTIRRSVRGRMTKRQALEVAKVMARALTKALAAGCPDTPRA